jgi:hypothetical protein
MNPWRGLGRPRFLSAVFAIAGIAGLALAVGFGKADPAVMAGYKTTGGGGGGGGPTSVKITQNAQFISTFQINVVLTISCNAGSGYFASVDVQQPQGFGNTTSGNGSTSGQCTGQQQKVAVPVYAFFNGWQLGNAVASATACTDTCGSDTKQIHIVR